MSSSRPHRTRLWARYLMAAALLAGGCKKDTKLPPNPPSQCDCEEPMDDDPENGDNGDSHRSFDLTVSELAASPQSPDLVGTSTEPIRELQPIYFSWLVTYDYEECGGSDAGTSGPFDCEYTLTTHDGSEVLWSGTEVLDLRLGDRERVNVTFEEGVEVPDSDSDGELPLLFKVELLPSGAQECDGDEANNQGFYQFVVLDCPCDGTLSREVVPADLVYNEGTRLLTWNLSYAAEPCGSRLPERESGPFTEQITVGSLFAGETFEETRAAPSIPLGSSIVRSLTLPDGVYDPDESIITLTISGLGGDVDCNPSQPDSINAGV